MVTPRVGALAAALLVAAAGSAAAQAVIRGRIRADSTRAAIPFAVVEIKGAGKATQASVSGIYALTDVPAGPHTITARAVGYQPLELPVDLAPGDTVDADLLLLRAATQLAPLEVVAPAARPLGKMARFEEHRQKGLGRQYDRAALSKLGEGAVVAQLLRATAGIRLIQLPSPCTGSAAASARGVGALEVPARMTCLGREMYMGCYLSVMVDGVVIWAWGEPDPPNVENINLAEFEAVEVYRGPSEIPIDLNRTGAACGLLVLWTRTGANP